MPRGRAKEVAYSTLIMEIPVSPAFDSFVANSLILAQGKSRIFQSLPGPELDKESGAQVQIHVR